MKLKMTLKEMKDADVTFISLVSRGANRIPFRIIKADEDNKMIDLGRIARVFKSEAVPIPPAKPEVELVAFAIMKQDEQIMEAVKKSLTDSGFGFDTVTENEDGSVTLSKGPIPDDVQLVRLSDDVITVVKGFSEYNLPQYGEMAQFSEVVATQGYFPGLRVASEALSDTIRSALNSSPTPTEAVSKVETILGEYAAYVKDLTASIPTVAFKAEDAVAEVLKAAKEKMPPEDATEDEEEMTKPEGVTQEEWDAMTTEEKAEYEKDKTKKESAEAKDAVDASVTEVTKALSEIAANMNAFSGALAKLGTSVDALSENQKNMQSQVDEVARKAETASTAVATTIAAGAAPGDLPSPGKVVKAVLDNDPRTGCFDTAFMPRRK